MSDAALDKSGRAPSFLAPFRHPAFAVIWTATLVSNIGGWMYSAASGWLMTGLDPDPLMVALVQAASSLPICLFAIPAGALADIFDKRKFLIVVETITTAVSAVYALIVGLGWATPANLLLFTFLIGAAGAMTVPAWQAVVTYLVAKDDLPPAIAANSVGVNISRALGPALGGVIIAAYGIVAPFWINAISNLGIVFSLLWWRPARRAGTCSRPSVSAKPSWRDCATHGIIGICGQRWYGLPDFFCLPALIGRCCRWCRASRSAAGRISMACCSARSGSARLPARFFCLGSRLDWAPIG
jgi:MFS family permease